MKTITRKTRTRFPALMPSAQVRASCIRAISLVLVAALSATSPARAAIGDHDWSKGITGTLNGRGDVSGAGHTSVYGIFFGTVDFGGGPRTGGSQDTGDVFVVRYSPNGGHLWDNTYTPTGNGGGVFDHYTTVDPAGNTYISGRLAGTTDIDFGGGVITGPQGFLAKFDTAGNHEWSFGFGEATLKALDASNTRVVGTGYLNINGAGADFGGGTITPVGEYDVVVAQFTDAGVHEWSAGFGDNDDERGGGIAIDASGNVTIAGGFEGSIDFGGGGVNAVSGVDVFIASFTSGGSHRWSHVIDGGFSMALLETHVAATSGNRIVLAGDFNTSVNAGGATLNSIGGDDLYLAMFNTTGGHQWSNSWGTSGPEDMNDVAASDSTGILISGRCSADLDLGGGALPTVPSFSNLFIGVFDDTGAHVYSNAYGTTSQCQNGFGQTGDIYLHGAQGTTTADFGGGQLSAVSLAMARLDGGDTSGTVTAIEDLPELSRMTLAAYPNPFNPTTTIRYELERSSNVTLQVVDVRGRVVDTLVSNELRAAGTHAVTFRAGVPTGVYFLRIHTANVSRAIKIVVVK